jgi:serine/threonine protein kinase
MAAEHSAMATRNLDEQAIFEVARKIDPGEAREAYLLQVCGEDAAIKRRVRALLKAYQESASFLESPAASLVAALDEPMRERPGTVIGPYKLLEQIGEGGMGLVFMAEQSRPVRRRVALKVIKPGMDTRQVVVRFEAERQALALMDHPHIAHVLDGGATASCRPYFVMELVRGVSITDFCDQRRFTMRQRLELFVTVCQAVQHAHQKGIIHRDLKPSNVLVTLHDTVAVPKVIDFGIAKATTQPLTERTLFTNFAQMLGTPLYMSPEQAEMNGLDVDTRSDVYALGALLYELLTGTTPFESQTLKKVGLDEMRRMIREKEPPTPSQRLNTLDAQACSTVSEHRGVDGRRLGQLLRGEVDWIVMKALEKDRERRDESVSAFAADVNRYLNDEAVAACPPSAVYRLRKYARRNRRLIIPAAVVTIVLTGATVVSTWLAIQADAARQLADTRLDKEKQAQAEAATDSAVAHAVSSFLQDDLLRQVNRLSKFGDDLGGNPNLTVKEALDRAAVKIDDRFQNKPLVEAAIRTAIGEAYGSLHEHQLAVDHLERAFRLRQTYHGPDHPDTLATMDSLAAEYTWMGRHPEAISLRVSLLEIRKSTHGPNHPETLECVAGLAVAYRDAGQCDISVRILEQLLDKQRSVLWSQHAATFNTMHDLAINYLLIDRLSESMALHEKLLKLRKSTCGAGDGSTIRCMLTFAQACQRAGKLDRADQLLRDALEQLQKTKDSLNWQNGTANALGWLGVNLLLQERYGDAEQVLREAIGINQIEKNRHYYWVSALGAVLLSQKRYAEAEPLLLQGYEGMKSVEASLRAGRRRLNEAGERVVRFYEATGQPENARAWREKLGPRDASAALGKERHP